MTDPKHFRREFEKVVESGFALFDEVNQQSEEYLAVLYSTVMPTGINTFANRLRKLATIVKDSSALAPYLAKLTEAQALALKEIADEKAEKAARASSRRLKAALVTKTGVSLGLVTRGDYEALAAALATLRATYITKLISKYRDSARTLIANPPKSADCLGWMTSIIRVYRTLGIKSIAVLDNAEEIAEKIAREVGEREFDSYVVKLAAKIGKTVISAVITGDLWSHSILRIETADGTQTWKTQMIINRSPLGTWFHQWPTTLVETQPYAQESNI